MNSISNRRIIAESKRQALDWCLALISQGVEATLDHDADAGWGLLVEDVDFPKAASVIDQYRLENLRWPWQQRIFTPSVAFDWGSLAWVFLLGMFFWMSERIPGFQDAGVMNSAKVSMGEWWRLLTAIDLHADTGHLASNAGIGFVLMGLVLGRLGTGIGLFAAFLAGGLGNCCSWWLYPLDHESLGASGMVMGCLGLLTVQSVAILKQSPKPIRLALAGFAAGVMLFVLTGLSPGSDVAAHLGGFLGGVLIGVPLALRPRVNRNAGANLAAGGLFCGLTVVAWWLAIQHGG